MNDYIVDDEIIVTGENRMRYAISVGVCIVVILLSFSMPIVSVYDKGVSIFGLTSLADTVDSFGSMIGQSDMGVGSGAKAIVFFLFYFPLILVSAVSLFNLKKTGKIYSTITIVIAIITAIGSYVMCMFFAAASESLSAIKMGPVVIQVICYALIAIFTYVFIRGPIGAQLKGVPYYEAGVGQSAGRKPARKPVNKGKRPANGRNTQKLSKFELENLRLNNSVETLKRNIGEKIYNNRIEDPSTAELIEKVDYCLQEIGKNNVEILRTDNMKACTNCGNISPEESRFCNECGNRYLDDPVYTKEQYIKISRKNIEPQSKNQTVLNLRQDNMKIMQDIDDIFVNIGEAVYTSTNSYSEDIERDIEQISSLKHMINRNKLAHLDERGLMLCSNCGNEISKDSKFCDSCGIKIAPQREEKREPENRAGREQRDFEEENKGVSANRGNICSNCGIPLNAKDVFCPNCGTKVER